MNILFSFAHWQPTEQGGFPLGLHLTSLTGAGSLGVLIAATGYFILTRKQQLYARTLAGLVCFCINAICLVGLILAADSLTFFAFWCGLILTAMVLSSRDSRSDGTLLAPLRWVPLQVSAASVLLLCIALFSGFKTIQWEEISLKSQSFIDENGVHSPLVIILAMISAWALFLNYPARRRDLVSCYQNWWVVVSAPVAALVLLNKMQFLTTHAAADAVPVSLVILSIACLLAIVPAYSPLHPQSTLCLNASLGALVCVEGVWGGVPFSQTRLIAIGGIAFILVVIAFVRMGPSAWSLLAENQPTPVGRGWNLSRFMDQLDDRAWPRLLRAPFGFFYSLGQAFVFWQGSSIHYSLVVLLVGTLFLFWAALKTQVLW